MKTSLLLPGVLAASILVGVSGAGAQTSKAADTMTTTTKSSDATMSGHHEMTGEVTKVDAKKGWVDVKTSEGSMKLHFPPDALQSVKKGDSITVDLGMTHVASGKSTGHKMGRTEKMEKTTTSTTTDTTSKTKQ